MVSVKWVPLSHGVDLVRNGLDQGMQEVCGHTRGGLHVQLGEGELGGPVDGDEEVEAAFLGADLSDVDVEVAGRIGLELALARLVTFDIGQA